MSTTADLLNYIFEDQQPMLYPEFEAWVQRSRRFKAFAESYRTKLRAKVRNARDPGGMQDLRAELETAALLLRAERFTLEYEKYAALKQRGPDFTVTFKTHTPFNVEVRRIRSSELEDEDTRARIYKLMAVVCEKVGQMPPSIINLLWLTAEREIAQEDLTRAVVALQQLADRQAEEYFTGRGFESPAHFLKQYGRLSGVVLHPPGETAVWLNSLARHKVLPEIATTIKRLDAL
jgi:hypothetical protein